jgi:Tol biopolymer transport system component
VVTFGSLPRWSPDGSKIAFGAEGVDAGIWVYNRFDESLIQITDATYPHLYDYRWAPDSDSLAFGGAGAIIDSTSGIFVVALDGSDPVRWHPTGGSPSWNPDGSGLVFAENDSQGGVYGLYLLNFADTSLTVLTASGIDPQFSPVGTQIAYREPGSFLATNLKVVPAAGGTPVVLADTCLSFDWSSDGLTLVYDYMGYGLTDSGMRICTIPVSGGTPQKIATSAGQPSVAVTGQVAYHGVQVDLTTGIYTVGIGGGNKRQLTFSGAQPDITSDGFHIAYARDDGIWIVSP